MGGARRHGIAIDLIEGVIIWNLRHGYHDVADLYIEATNIRILLRMNGCEHLYVKGKQRYSVRQKICTFLAIITLRITIYQLLPYCILYIFSSFESVCYGICSLLPCWLAYSQNVQREILACNRMLQISKQKSLK